MFAGIRSFVCRHRRKFIIGGVLVGGIAFATHYVQRKLHDWQEREMKEFFERTQRQQHFEKNERTCNQTILSLTPSLCDKVGTLSDTEAILEKLKNGLGDKVTLWEEMKIMSFTRLSALLYSGTMFVILLRVQVNLIGGHLYHHLTSESSADTIDKKLQEDYLSLCEYFLTTGAKDLCSLIETKVRFVLEGESLKKKLTLQDVEHYFWAIQSAISSDPDDPLSHMSKYLLPSTYVEDIRGSDKSAVYDMVNDTVEIIETNEVKSLAASCISRGFASIMDRISEFFIPVGLDNCLALPGTSSGTNAKASSRLPNGSLDYKKVTMPMAKLVPIVNGLANVKGTGSNVDAYEQWVQQFINMQNLKMLGANIYESFSNPSTR